MAFDRAGNETLLTGAYKPPAALRTRRLRPRPTSSAPPARPRSSLRWTTVETGITGYGVQAYNEAGAKVGALVTTTAKNITINGLTANKTYFFTVKAKNAGRLRRRDGEARPLTPTAITDRVTIGTAKWKNGDFRVTGTASVIGAIVTVYGSNTETGAIDRNRRLGTAQVTAAAPLRRRAASTTSACGTRAAPPTNPGRIYVESNGGGIAGPFTVANG